MKSELPRYPGSSAVAKRAAAGRAASTLADAARRVCAGQRADTR